MVSGDRGAEKSLGGTGGAPVNRISVIMRPHAIELPCPPAMWRHKEMAYNKQVAGPHHTPNL